MKISQILSHNLDDIEREVIRLNCLTETDGDIIITVHDIWFDDDASLVMRCEASKPVSEDEWKIISAEIKRLIGGAMEKELTLLKA
jgi:hypothetical protein